MTTDVLLNDPALFVGKNYINGQWVPAVSGKTFDVAGKYINVFRIFSSTQLITAVRSSDGQLAWFMSGVGYRGCRESD